MARFSSLDDPKVGFKARWNLPRDGPEGKVDFFVRITLFPSHPLPSRLIVLHAGQKEFPGKV
eukprot:766605-Hanusia_phi.AAC.5